MTVQRLQAMLDDRAFRPFSIHTSDGEVVRAKSPEFAWLHPSKRVIFVATSSTVDREEVIDLLHITKLSRLETRNGAKGGRTES